MKAHAIAMESFLTEGERRIAEQVKRMRDLNAKRDVVGSGHQQKPAATQFSARNASRPNVKDSHDRYS